MQGTFVQDEGDYTSRLKVLYILYPSLKKQNLYAYSSNFLLV